MKIHYILLTLAILLSVTVVSANINTTSTKFYLPFNSSLSDLAPTPHTWAAFGNAAPDTTNYKFVASENFDSSPDGNIWTLENATPLFTERYSFTLYNNSGTLYVVGGNDGAGSKPQKPSTRKRFK